MVGVQLNSRASLFFAERYTLMFAPRKLGGTVQVMLSVDFCEGATISSTSVNF